MATICTTERFILEAPGSVIAPLFNNCNNTTTLSPQPLFILLQIAPTSPIGYYIEVVLDLNNPFNTVPLLRERSLPGVSITDSPGGKGVQLISDIPGLDNSLYKSGDTYVVNTSVAQNYVYLSFGRTPSISINATGTSMLEPISQLVGANSDSGFVAVNPSNNKLCAQPPSIIELPRITVAAQTNINGIDLGDAVYKIYDIYQYYDKHTSNIQANNPYILACENYCAEPDIKVTEFTQCCMNIVNILKGTGATASAKIANLRVTNNLSITYLQFWENIMIYVTARQILSKILFGEFDVKYTLQKYDTEFRFRLEKSRFKAFTELFYSPTSPVYMYNVYFKWSV